MNKTAIITGVTGQMGSYFSEFLLEKNFKVIGGVRRLSVPNKTNIKNISNDNFVLETMDLGDSHSINSVILKYKPDYFINCAANSFVGSSWDCPEQHIEYNTLGVLRQLEAIRKHSPLTRYINFGSSEEFGDVLNSLQDESHPPRARSPYGASKVAARQLVKVYRESYNLYALQCWCFNYESPRRGFEFISKKITSSLSSICKKLQNNESFEPIEIGNMNAKRDWSHAKDFVDGVWRMLNQEKFNEELKIKASKCPIYLTGERTGAERFLSIQQDIEYLSKHIKEYVLASGKTYTVKDLIITAINHSPIINLGTIKFIGSGLDEKCVLVKPSGEELVLIKVNSKFFRPAEVELLCGNSQKIRNELNWEPNYSFNGLIKEMMEYDLKEQNL